MRYLVKWSKEGNMKYISHLDMMRLFQRALKRGDIKLQYSQGFSPHPKMSIAQPLTLGYTSCGEYIELETVIDFDPKELKTRLSSALPEGISVLSCTELLETKKAGASVFYGAYEIRIEADTAKAREAVGKAMEDFMASPHIYMEKLQKKSGKIQQIDLKDYIRTFQILEKTEGEVLIETVIKTGSQSHLNPDLLVKGFQTFLPQELRQQTVTVSRKEMFTQAQNGTLMPLYELK